MTLHMLVDMLNIVITIYTIAVISLLLQYNYDSTYVG